MCCGQFERRIYQALTPLVQDMDKSRLVELLKGISNKSITLDPETQSIIDNQSIPATRAKRQVPMLLSGMHTLSVHRMALPGSIKMTIQGKKLRAAHELAGCELLRRQAALTSQLRSRARLLNF